ncbi:hypothetical protein [Gallaecimonas mangrovi]|uniref:hypothetical protein n=1 Tax=Gallaecimonas mangrovi TaxID=2291597 RepID=UPI000E20852D|nr:hypothetical protein [Gallaecimonas mangrovi]
MESQRWVFLFILGLVALGIARRYFCGRLRLQEQKVAASLSQNGADTQAMKAQIAQMEERIRALEAIVTDEGYQLSQKISALDSQSKAS